MNRLDYLFLTMIGVSALFGFLRGAIREAVGLLGWFAALAVAVRYAKPLEGRLLNLIHQPLLASGLAFLLMFVLVLLSFWIFGRLLKRWVRSAHLGWLDQSLGLLFGLTRGVMIVVFFAIALHLSHQSPSKNSVLFPYGMRGADYIAGFLPKEMALATYYRERRRPFP